jgi:hypothetical protein
MAYFSVEAKIEPMQMISSEQLSLLDPLVYAGYYPLAVYQYTLGSGHNFQPGKAIIGYIFLGREGNQDAIRYYIWADKMTRNLFRSGAHPVLSAALSLGGPAFGYRVSLIAQFYGGQHQLR